MILALLSLLFTGVALADEAQEAGSGDAESVRSVVAQKHHDRIQEVLAQREFGSTQPASGWRLKKNDPDKEDSEDTRSDEVPEWLINIIEFFESNDTNEANNSTGVIKLSQGIEVLLWALLIALIVFVVIRYRDQIGRIVTGLNKPDRDKEMPVNMFGLDVKKESLPDNVIEAASTHWHKGESRLAIAVLLRATLIKLLDDYDCKFFDSDTEAECCLRVDNKSPAAVSSFMRSLVGAWQQIAYAHQTPSDDTFEDLCQRWQEVFNVAA